MKFDVDMFLRKVAGAMAKPKPADVVAVELCRRMIDEDVIEDCEENYGKRTLEALGATSVYHILYVLQDYLGVPYTNIAIIDALCNTTLMGDGHCPHCGGRLEFSHREHEIIEVATYDHEAVTETVNYYVCQTCGRTIQTLDEYD